MPTSGQITDYAALRRNITGTVILVSVTPLLLVNIILVYYFHTVYSDKVLAHLEEIVERHRENVDAFLNDRLRDIAILVDYRGVAELAESAFLADRLAKLQKHYDHAFVDLGLVNDEGRLIAYAGPYQLTEVDYSQTDWFKGARARNTYISDVFSGVRGTPHFIVTVQAHEKGQTYVLRATIDFAAFNALVKGVHIGKTGLAFIINRRGDFQTDRRPDESIDTLALPKIVSQDYSQDPTQVTERMDANGQDVLYVSTPLKNGDWLMIYQQKTEDALSHLFTARTLSIAILLLGGAAICFTAVLLTRRLVARVSLAETEKKLMHQQVVETSKLATIGELAAGIAHEINNPVAIMIEEAGWIEDLLTEEAPCSDPNLKDIHHALNQIGIQGQRCKEITHKLLSFARRTDPRKQDVLVNQIIEEVVALSFQRARLANVALEMDLAANLPLINISPSEFQQVMLNLINNAIDARDKDKGTVKITTSDEDNFVVIDVADNGLGIPEPNLARIFEPFFTTKAVGKGTGLGLSICYGIIDKSGGNITVDSEVGQGTVFHVRLPAVRPR